MGSPAMPPQELTVPQDKGINATTDIPVIDLASWNEATTEVSSSRKASLAATWHRAFSTHGLVWLVGHGLDPLYEHVAAKWRHFCQQDDAGRGNIRLYGTGAVATTGLEQKQLQDQKEETESLILLSPWKVDTRISLVDPSPGLQLAIQGVTP